VSGAKYSCLKTNEGLCEGVYLYELAYSAIKGLYSTNVEFEANSPEELAKKLRKAADDVEKYGSFNEEHPKGETW
jgi:D-alanine-D-alanine ligase-like ATP-grasp enzyme